MEYPERAPTQQMAAPNAAALVQPLPQGMVTRAGQQPAAYAQQQAYPQQHYEQYPMQQAAAAPQPQHAAAPTPPPPPAFSNAFNSFLAQVRDTRVLCGPTGLLVGWK